MWAQPMDILSRRDEVRCVCTTWEGAGKRDMFGAWLNSGLWLEQMKEMRSSKRRTHEHNLRIILFFCNRFRLRRSGSSDLSSISGDATVSLPTVHRALWLPATLRRPRWIIELSQIYLPCFTPSTRGEVIPSKGYHKLVGRVSPPANITRGNLNTMYC